MEKPKKRTFFLFFTVLFCSFLFSGLLGWFLAMTVNTVNTENFTNFETALPTKLLDINGELITEFASAEKREIIDFNQLPQHMIEALLTREDKIFYKHGGFSVKALTRAVVGKLTGRSLGGGSTLTQQIAGTLYCDRSDISYSRKLVELWWALQMERRYSKNEILELYLNKIYFGGGTYGVNAASKYYFGHGATEITPAEAAILVIQLSNPAFYNPFDHPNRAMDRQQDVLNSMVAQGYLSKEVAEKSFDDYWLAFDYTRINSSAYFMREDKAPWFSEYVLRQLNSLIYGNLDIYTGGFTVNTTLNMSHQEAADKVMAKQIAYANNSYEKSSGERKSDAITTYIPVTELLSLLFDIPSLKVSRELNESTALSTFNNQINPVLDMMSLICNIEPLKVGVTNRVNAQKKNTVSKTTIEGTMISLENETGYITSLVGGSKFDSENQFIRAIQARVQPGSSFKPLVYSAAIDTKKFTAASTIYDAPTIFYSEDGTPYMPNNFKGEWKGSVQLWYALSQSMNVPTLKILDGIGFDAAIERAVSLLGIPENELQSRGFARVYPLGLGVCSVRPVEIARAFAIFGNQGKEVTPIAIRSVEDRTGKIFLNPEKDLRLEQKKKGENIQVISPQTAFIMTDILKRTVTEGTLARGAGWGWKFKFDDSHGNTFTMPMAGKTGTTQNWADAWAVGYSPYYTAAFWFGFDRAGQSLGLDLTGATLAGVAWGDFMKAAHKGLPFRDFIEPSSGVIKATVCSVSGDLLTPSCGNHQTEQYFLEGTQPLRVCELHSGRETAKALAVERLSYEKSLSGVSGHLFKDDSLLEVDLSFLKNPSLLLKQETVETPVSLEGNKTEETQDMVLDLFEKEEVEEATYNYFLD